MKGTGIIVGRFQVPTLHEGHRKLIERVLANHLNVILFLGISPTPPSKTDPLNFESRKKMIEKEYPTLSILPLINRRLDSDWDRELDLLITNINIPDNDVILYGSEDSFLSNYFGKYPTITVASVEHHSGTFTRKESSQQIVDSEDFRLGVIWATQRQYDKVHPTVDCIILNEDFTQVLLGKKADDDLYCFIGGFADPNDESYEMDIKREVKEELGINIIETQYEFSSLIKDWRYRKGDKVKTLVFSAVCPDYEVENVIASDDIEDFKWFDMEDVADNIVDVHAHIWNKFYNNKERFASV